MYSDLSDFLVLSWADFFCVCVKDGKSSAEEGKTDKEAKAEDDKKADEETPTVKEEKKRSCKK